MALRAGKLTKRVEVQELTETRDAHGGITETWTTIATRWASVEPLSGRERWSAEQVDSDITHRIRMRRFRGLTTNHRIRWDGRVFNLRSVLNLDEADVEHELLCVEPTGGAS